MPMLCHVQFVFVCVCNLNCPDALIKYATVTVSKRGHVLFALRCAVVCRPVVAMCDAKYSAMHFNHFKHFNCHRSSVLRVSVCMYDHSTLYAIQNPRKSECHAIKFTSGTQRANNILIQMFTQTAANPLCDSARVFHDQPRPDHPRPRRVVVDRAERR